MFMCKAIFRGVWLSVVASVATAISAHAQYYSWGADAANLTWSQMNGDRVSVIYPDTLDGVARRVLHYINYAQSSVSEGFRYSALDLPFVMHPENFSSNGLVMWMPKRVEFLATPAADGYSMLWRKSLVAHEYRHAVQYNNLNRGWVRGLSYLLGEQGAAVGLLFMPVYAMEGDAVMVETQMSTYGRALQPEFTMEYRALVGDLMRGKNLDRWFCGSYRQNIPDHYKLGYQIVRHSYNRFDENVWDKVVNHAVRNPYLLFTTYAGLKKYYDTSIDELTRESFSELEELWRPLAETKNTMSPISKCDTKNYTTYSHPIALLDGRVIALKSDFERASRFVAVDPESGEEEILARTGSVSSRPMEALGRVWWTEYSRSMLFSEKVNSQLYYMDLDAGAKPQRAHGVTKSLYPTPIGSSRDRVAYVEYLPSGQYFVVERGADREVRRVVMPDYNEIHGLAWDNLTNALYVIVTGEDGMWIAKCTADGFEPLHEGRFITISDLRARDGVLYYGSIASGRDELWSRNIKSGVERQISESKFGSFQPSLDVKGEINGTSLKRYIYGTTYDRYGYRLSRQDVADAVGERAVGQIPSNLVNPKSRSLGLVNLDTVRYELSDSVEMEHKSHAKRYHKALHLFDIHSWAPVSFSPYEIMDEQVVDLTLGATLLNQNQLSSTEGYLTYGWSAQQGSVVKGLMSYNGLGVNLSVGATYGGDRVVYALSGQQSPTSECYKSVSVSASLPMIFARGYMTRQLSVAVSWNYSNGAVADLDNILFNYKGEMAAPWTVGYNIGLHKLSMSVGYGASARSAYRDIASPWSYWVSGGYSLNPTNSDFSSLVMTYGSVGFRGGLPHSAVSLAVNYQTKVGGYRINDVPLLGYSSVYILPRGYQLTDVDNNNYLASTFNYKVPVWYPEGGIKGVAYLKRVTVGVGVDYAQYNIGSVANGVVERLYSVGGDISLDINFLRMPASGTTTVEFSVYKPQNRELYIQAGLALPF
ncbi:MAG: hypothetical protein SNH01_04265 [Rikenellaceae bacterium]